MIIEETPELLCRVSQFPSKKTAFTLSTLNIVADKVVTQSLITHLGHDNLYQSRITINPALYTIVLKDKCLQSDRLKTTMQYIHEAKNSLKLTYLNTKWKCSQKGAGDQRVQLSVKTIDLSYYKSSGT